MNDQTNAARAVASPSPVFLFTEMAEQNKRLHAENRHLRDELLRAVERLKLCQSHFAICDENELGRHGAVRSWLGRWIEEHEAALSVPV